MVTHDAVMVDIANKARFLAIMRPSMRVDLDAMREARCLLNEIRRQDTVEIHPLSAIRRPRGSAKRLLKARCDDGFLQLDQMFASHVLPPKK